MTLYPKKLCTKEEKRMVIKMKDVNKGKSVPITKGRQSAAVIVVSKDAPKLEQLAAVELARYIEKLSYAKPDIVGPDDIEKDEEKTLLLVGSPETNPLAGKALAEMQNPEKLKAGGFVIHTDSLDKHPVVVISGVDEVGTLYGVYAILEMLGATFLLTGDLLPEPMDNLSFQAISQTFQASMSRRGFLTGPFNLHSSIWGLQDYLTLIDQMVKLRLNLLIFVECVGQPWIEYSYRGEKRLIGDLTLPESGYLRIRLNTPSVNVNQVHIGTEHFRGRRYMVPPEMEDVNSQEEAFRKFSGMMKEVLSYARKRGIFTGIAMLANYVPPNLARFTRRHGPRPFQVVYGAEVSPTDPVASEITEQRLKAIFETYPDIDYLFACCSENAKPCQHNDSLKLYKRMLPSFAQSLQTIEDNWMSVTEKFSSTPEQIIESDIGFLEVARKTAELAKKMQPDKSIGMGFFFRGYMLQDADKLVDRDFAFMDFQSSGVFPLKDDVNAMYFAGMGERERMIIPRGDDDGSMFGMPFYLRQFHKDGLFKEAQEAGVTGFACQMNRARGTEHHTRFLAQGAWEPELTPDRFYERYSEEIFGAAVAGRMKKVFDILEENEEMLGWRGNMNFTWAGGPIDLTPILLIRGYEHLLTQINPFDGPSDPAAMLAAFDSCAPDRGQSGSSETVTTLKEGKRAKFERAVGMLGRALQEMKLVQTEVSAKGKPLLEYLISKTGAYKSHLEMTVLIECAFAEYAQAFINNVGNEPMLAKALKQAESIFIAAEVKAREAASKVAEIIDHPSDLAILFLTNTWCVNKIAEVNDIVRRVVNYHCGLPYWKEADRSAGKQQEGFAL